MSCDLEVTNEGVRGKEKISSSGRGGEVSGNLWYSPPASMMSRIASVTFKMASIVFIEETDKNFDFIKEIYCSDFLDLEILRFLLS